METQWLEQGLPILDASSVDRRLACCATMPNPYLLQFEYSRKSKWLTKTLVRQKLFDLQFVVNHNSPETLFTYQASSVKLYSNNARRCYLDLILFFKVSSIFERG